MAIVVLSRPQMHSAFNQLLIALCFFDSVFLVVSVCEAGMSLGFSGKQSIVVLFNQIAVTFKIFDQFKVRIITLTKFIYIYFRFKVEVC